jgi:hypothetical protein
VWSAGAALFLENFPEIGIEELVWPGLDPRLIRQRREHSDRHRYWNSLERCSPLYRGRGGVPGDECHRAGRWNVGGRALCGLLHCLHSPQRAISVCQIDADQDRYDQVLNPEYNKAVPRSSLFLVRF